MNYISTRITKLKTKQFLNSYLKQINFANFGHKNLNLF